MNIVLSFVKQHVLILSITCIAGILLLLSVKGFPGTPTPTDLNTKYWRQDGVFELSPERGRYALTYSIVEDGSVFHNKQIARFAVPDIAIHDGKYVSLFAPGLSYITAPGYMIGKFFGNAQFGTFAVVSFFALLNFILVYLISKQLGAYKVAALLGAITFLFATPAFVYGVNLYQHHLSTFLILLSIYLLMKYRSIWTNIIVFILCGASISVDYPNLFFMMPVGLVAFSRLFKVEDAVKKITIQINLPKLLTPFIIILPLLFLFWYQNTANGGPLRLSGSLQTAKFEAEESSLEDVASLSNDVLHKEEENEDHADDKNVVGFFESRILLNSFYLHFISPDRGMLTFTPVILLGFIGLIIAYRKQMPYLSLLTSVLFSIIILYSLWGDPWGGWAFGSRYLVPAYAILGIFVAMLLSYAKRNIFLQILFLILLFYSLGVSTIGALTTIANPPQVEVLALEELTGTIQRYSYDRGMEYLNRNDNKSFIFNTFAKNHLSAWQYYSVIYIPLLITSAGLLVALQLTKEKKS
ncbi:MAG TPA: hypothetical protein PLS49_05685 [Candidatus Woesebacteria bacterium]|nr:hypothetical protein [Candidatus Woesebacteria bacterium]